MKDWMIALVVCATFSVIGSISVIATFICFKRMRNQLFMQLVAYISIGDLIGNFPLMFPYRPNSGWVCSLQAFMNLSGYPMDWLWTLALVYLLFRLSMTGKYPCQREMRLMHLVCWMVPITLAAFVRIVSKYTREHNGIQTCTQNTTTVSHTYHIIAYYGLFYTVLFIMVILLIKIKIAENRGEVNAKSSAFKVAKSALQWYPVIYIIFWLPHSIFSLADLQGGNIDEVYNAGLLWKVQHGLVTAIIFFAQSAESRRLWFSLPWVQAIIGNYFTEEEVNVPVDMSIVDFDTEMVPVTSVDKIVSPILVNSAATVTNELHNADSDILDHSV